LVCNERVCIYARHPCSDFDVLRLRHLINFIIIIIIYYNVKLVHIDTVSTANTGLGVLPAGIDKQTTAHKRKCTKNLEVVVNKLIRVYLYEPLLWC